MIRLSGRNAAPAAAAGYPWMRMRLNGMKNIAPLSAKYSNSVIALAPLKAGLRNSCSGIIGECARRSNHTNATRTAAPTSSRPGIAIPHAFDSFAEKHGATLAGKLCSDYARQINGEIVNINGGSVLCG